MPTRWREKPPIPFPRKYFNEALWKLCPHLCNMTQMSNSNSEGRVGPSPETFPVFLFSLPKLTLSYVSESVMDKGEGSLESQNSQIPNFRPSAIYLYFSPYKNFW